MSSHREAPEIAKDPVADSADLYAFVSPDRPDRVTIIANYVPLQGPDGGPNFYSFGDDVQYWINVDNDGDGDADISFQFQFATSLENPDSFLYNSGPIRSLTDTSWNRRQTYSVTRVEYHESREPTWTALGEGLACPPCNIGPLSTPDYPSLADAAVHSLGGGVTVFAGQRADGFYVDLGAIFDLGILRPFEGLHTLFGLTGTGVAGSPPGVSATKALNVHSIAIQLPITALTADGRAPSDPSSPASVVGIWTTANRRKVQVREGWHRNGTETGPWVQVSRLGNPLVNEVIIPLGRRTTGTRSTRGSTSSSRRSSPTPSSLGCSPRSTRGSSRTSGRTTPARRTARTSWRSCSRGSPRGWSRGSRTTPARSRPTCSA